MCVHVQTEGNLGGGEGAGRGEASSLSGTAPALVYLAQKDGLREKRLAGSEKSNLVSDLKQIALVLQPPKGLVKNGGSVCFLRRLWIQVEIK